MAPTFREARAHPPGNSIDEAAAAIREILAADPEASAQFEAVLNALALWMRGRERGRTTAAMLMHEIRLAGNELGRRYTEKGALSSPRQIYMLFADELPDFLENPQNHTATLADRERTYLELFDRMPPFVVDGTPPPPVVEWALRSDNSSVAAVSGEAIVGVPACGGTARGRARVITSPDDPSALEPGDILVAPLTDPSWTAGLRRPTRRDQSMGYQGAREVPLVGGRLRPAGVGGCGW